MEYINKIELRGIVGTATLNRVGDSQVCRFSIATDYSYKDRDGNPLNQPIDKFNHLLDALRYAVWTRFAQRAGYGQYNISFSRNRYGRQLR